MAVPTVTTAHTVTAVPAVTAFTTVPTVTAAHTVTTVPAVHAAYTVITVPAVPAVTAVPASSVGFIVLLPVWIFLCKLWGDTVKVFVFTGFKFFVGCVNFSGHSLLLCSLVI